MGLLGFGISQRKGTCSEINLYGFLCSYWYFSYNPSGELRVYIYSHQQKSRPGLLALRNAKESDLALQSKLIWDLVIPRDI